MTARWRTSSGFRTRSPEQLLLSSPCAFRRGLVERTRKKLSESLSAYECFLQALWLSDKTSGNGTKSLDLLAKAIRNRPDLCAGHALTAIHHCL